MDINIEQKELSITKADLYSPLNLAYLGDSVFELCVRAKVLAEGNVPVKDLNLKARQIVTAGAQSAMYYKIYDELTEAEKAVVKRGRNAKSASKAKHSSLTDYKHATGLEALFGYLYLNGSNDRILELFELGTKTKEENNGKQTNRETTKV